MLFLKGVVVSSNNCPDYLECHSLLKKGDALELKHESSNPYDKDACAVYWQGIQIGYVRNTGKTCMTCLSSLKKKTTQCTQCNSFNLIEKGQAYRIVHSGVLEEGYVAVISESPSTDSRDPIKFKVWSFEEEEISLDEYEDWTDEDEEELEILDDLNDYAVEDYYGYDINDF